MFDTIQKLKYRANAGLAHAKDELNNRLTDCMGFLAGLHGEKLYLTGVTELRKKQQNCSCSMIRPLSAGV